MMERVGASFVLRTHFYTFLSTHAPKKQQKQPLPYWCQHVPTLVLPVTEERCPDKLGAFCDCKRGNCHLLFHTSFVDRHSSAQVGMSCRPEYCLIPFIHHLNLDFEFQKLRAFRRLSHLDVLR